MRFQVPSSLSPGIYRTGIGFVKAGKVVELGAGDKLNAKLIPLDKAAHDALVKAYPGVKFPEFDGAKEAKPEAKPEGGKSTGGRAADK